MVPQVEPTHESPVPAVQTPQGNLAGFRKFFVSDLTSGFLVFLIALPLCLGISLASGYPPLAGIFTAIVGSIVATLFSNSEMTIKGPAAGLIVIAVGAITEMKEIFGDERGYAVVLGIGVIAGLLQIGFALLRGGVLSEFFPGAAVHGMLAAIGVIIILKQLPIALGFMNNKGEPLELIERLPEVVMGLNPAIASLGVISFAALAGLPYLAKRHRWLKAIPAPVIILAFAIPFGMILHLTEASHYQFAGKDYSLGPEFLVDIDPHAFGMFASITPPAFDALTTMAGWKWIMMFAVIGTLESLLSAKAVDLLDPYRRRTNLDRDLLAVGVGNTLAASIGGLPMISEIVRSKANIDNGAKTRFSNFWHGILLLTCVATVPMVIHLIPLAALAAMLVYTGCRLASPAEFLAVYRIGRGQLLVFVTTLVAVLCTDLLIGIAIGIASKFLLLALNGVSPWRFFVPDIEVDRSQPNVIRIQAHEAAVFSHWIALRKQIERICADNRDDLILDLSDVRVVDHSMMEKLHELQELLQVDGRRLQLVGLEELEPVSSHPLATRRRRPVRPSAT